MSFDKLLCDAFASFFMVLCRSVRAEFNSSYHIFSLPLPARLSGDRNTLLVFIARQASRQAGGGGTPLDIYACRLVKRLIRVFLCFVGKSSLKRF